MAQNVLQFDYEKILGQRLAGTCGIGAIRRSGGGTCFEILELIFDRGVLRISVTKDTDELIVSYSDVLPSSLRKGNAVAGFERYMGREIGWCWVGTNYRGYKDSVTISFSGLEPSLLLLAEGSTIGLFRVTAI